jgi:hypothetical protein
MMDATELIVAILVVAIFLGVLVGVIASRVAVDRLLRNTKQDLAEQAANLKHRNHVMTVREEAVTQAEQGFAHRVAEAVAALHATQQLLDDDTTISDAEQEWLPELQDRLNDTVLMPRIEEEL